MKLTYTQLGVLVKAVKRKDAHAFSKLYENTHQAIYYLALSILKNPQDAQDAVQETYIKIIETINTLENDKLFVAWSNRIAYNISLRMLEKNRKNIPVEDTFLVEFQEDKNESDILSRLIVDENKKSCMRLIEQLDSALQTTIILKYYPNLKISEIAKIMSCPEGTVKSRLNKAKKLLKEKFANEMSGSMLFGIGMMPFKNSLMESAKTINIDMQTAFDILTNTLYVNNMHTAVSFSPVDSVAHVKIGGISAKAAIGTVGTISAGAISAAMISSSLAVPMITDIKLTNNGKEYIASPAIIEVQIDSSDNLKEVYSISEKGDKIGAIPQSETTYTISVDQNGIYAIYIVGKRGESDTNNIAVTNIDNTRPKVLSYENSISQLDISLEDTESGIDYSSIFGIRSDKSYVYPISIDESSNKVVFEIIDGGFELYISDKVGNQSKNLVEIIKS